MATTYVEYLKWVGYGLAAIGGWRYLPLVVIRLVAAFTGDEDRHRRCMEVLRLSRRDAARIPSYLPELPPRNRKQLRATPASKA
jgi:hypothetical protein